MQNDSDRFFVLTGGPGSGKTTLIEALRSAGFATSVEAGRGIIRDQLAIGGPALPWSCARITLLSNSPVPSSSVAAFRTRLAILG